MSRLSLRVVHVEGEKHRQKRQQNLTQRNSACDGFCEESIFEIPHTAVAPCITTLGYAVHVSFPNSLGPAVLWV